MQHARAVGRPPCRSLCLAVSLVLVASACAHVGECDSSDSTSSCCVKENPGEYERCGAVAPPAPRSPPNRLLPELTEPGRPEAEATPIPELPTQEERDRWEKEICLPHYEKCRSGRHDGRVWGESHCKACFAACMRYGYWPLRANGKLCPGA
jgi:hypothetical protein